MPNPGTKAREKRAKTHSNRSLGISIANAVDTLGTTIRSVGKSTPEGRRANEASQARNRKRRSNSTRRF